MPVGHIYLLLVDISTASFLSHIAHNLRSRTYAWIYARDCKKPAVKGTHLVRAPAISSAGEKNTTLERARTLFHPRVIILLLVSVILQVIL